MTKKTDNKKLIKKVVDKFNEYKTINIKIGGFDVQTGDKLADAVLELEYGDVKKELLIEVRKGITTQTIGNLIHRANLFRMEGVILTDYINPNIAERLKQLDIPFIDAAGNAYINEPPLFIYIKGNRPEEKVDKKEITRAFQQTGLKVIFAILCEPELVNAPYRKIQKLTDVALGTVGWVFDDLRKQKYVLKVGKKRILRNKVDLFYKWVDAYNLRLRPKLFLGTYKAGEDLWYKNVNVYKHRALWGGEIAGEMLTYYLKPEIATVYIRNERNNLNNFLLENRLTKDKQGNVELYEIFCGRRLIENYNYTVHPIIAYADLMATGDPRNIETAKLIYEENIQGLIKE